MRRSGGFGSGVIQHNPGLAEEFALLLTASFFRFFLAAEGRKSNNVLVFEYAVTMMVGLCQSWNKRNKTEKKDISVHSTNNFERAEEVASIARLIRVANELSVQFLVASQSNTTGLFVVIVEQFFVSGIKILDVFVCHPVTQSTLYSVSPTVPSPSTSIVLNCASMKNLKAAGKSANDLPFADFSMPFLNSSLETSPSLLKSANSAISFHKLAMTSWFFLKVA